MILIKDSINGSAKKHSAVMNTSMSNLNFNYNYSHLSSFDEAIDKVVCISYENGINNQLANKLIENTAKMLVYTANRVIKRLAEKGIVISSECGFELAKNDVLIHQFSSPKKKRAVIKSFDDALFYESATIQSYEGEIIVLIGKEGKIRKVKLCYFLLLVGECENVLDWVCK